MTIDTAKYAQPAVPRPAGDDSASHLQRRYRSLVLASASLVWATDVAGQIIEETPGWEAFTGQTFDQYRGAGWLEAIHPDDRDHARQVWLTTTGPRRATELEYRVRHRDGNWHHMLVRLAPVLDERGECCEWIAAATDISDRVRVADALREEVRISDILYSVGMALAAELDLQKLAQRLIDAGTSVTRARCGVFFYNATDQDGQPVTMRSISGSGAEAFASFVAPRQGQLGGDRGLRADELTAEQFANTLPSSHSAQEVSVRSLLAVPVVWRSGQVIGSLVFGHPQASAFTSRDERIIRGLASHAAVAIDNARLVHDLRTAQQRLAGQLEFTRSITDSLGEGLYAVDTAGRATFVNPAALKMLGFAADDLVGKDMHELVHYRHADGSDFPRETCPLIDVIRTGQSIAVEEDTFIRRDGSVFPVSYTSSPTREEGKITGAVVAFRDVTEQKFAREALRRYSDELERLVRERTAELELTNAQLRLSNRELEDFASVASHDLQEPLRKIQAFGDRLMAKVGPDLSADGQDYLRRMRGAAGRMQTLISDLLSFSRVTTKAQPFTRVDLNQVARDVLVDLEARLEQTGGRVEVGELPQIDADPTQMRQLIQNLIGNALKFHKPGVPPAVKVHAEASDGAETCRLIVEDNGIGFDEKYLDRIFNVFQRLHGRGQYEGTGIGLAVCRKIAERHGGSISARSTSGEGSSFVVTLPTRHATVEGTSDAE